MSSVPSRAPQSTDEKRTAGSLDQFKLLVESVKDYAIFLLDPDGHVRTWNAGAERIKGYHADEIIGCHFSKFYTEEARLAEHPQWLLEQARTEGRVEEEGPRVRKDGSTFFADVLLTALRDSSGTLRGFAKITRDLSARHREEERLRQSEERLRLLVEQVKDYAIFMLDPDGTVISWNVGAERIKGYAAQDIIGQNFSAFYATDALERRLPQNLLEQARRDGSAEDAGWRVRRDGSRFWANVAITALRGGNGELRGFAKVTRDMSDRRQIKQLESDAELMRQFVAMLGHELRNPIAPIAHAATIAAHPDAEAQERQWALDVIVRQSTVLKRIVDDLLDVSRITRGLIALEREPVDLRTAVDAAVEAVVPYLGGKQLAIERDMPVPAVVLGDPIRLTQVATNLLTNACRYTPAGGRIELTLEQQDGRVRLRVRDNGIGIDPSLIDHIFELFVQGERDLDRREGGLGLGLTIARQLAEGHGGKLEVSSAGSGHGSEFTLTLPAAEPAP